MDPITIIVAALTVGAASGVGDAASQLVKDAYDSLKARILARLPTNPRAIAVLEDHATDPETYDKPLIKFIKDEQLTQDLQILQLATRVLEVHDPEGATVGKYRIEVSEGGQVGNIGDYGTVTMNISGRNRSSQ